MKCFALRLLGALAALFFAPCAYAQNDLGSGISSAVDACAISGGTACTMRGPVRQALAAEATVNFISTQQPFTSGSAPYQIGQTSALQNGFYNTYTCSGYNLGNYPGFGGGVSGQPSLNMCFENDFYTGSNHTMEWYLDYRSPDNSSVTFFRPFYTSVLRDNNSSHAANTIFDIGDATGSLKVFANAVDAVNPLFTMTTASTNLQTTSVQVTKGSFTVSNSANAAIFAAFGSNTASANGGIVRVFGGLGHTNFQIGGQINDNNSLEFTPSTAVNGGTFNTPGLTILASSAVKIPVSAAVGGCTIASNVFCSAGPVALGATTFSGTVAAGAFNFTGTNFISAAGSFQGSGATKLDLTADGFAKLQNQGSTSGIYIDVGTASGVAWFKTLGNTDAGVVKASAQLASGAVPTPSGSCPVNTQTGGNTAGTFKANGACIAGTVILTFATTAPTGWTCRATDQTTPADIINQTASSTTTATFTGTMATLDVVSYACTAY